MSQASLDEDLALDSLVARVADEFRERQQNGEKPDIEEYAARHPRVADLLRKVLGALELIHLSLPGGLEADGTVTGTLGDFRILREVGRGGMGIVYEAEQISLGRRVALKVLPFASTLDAKQLQRFKNEAQAAACLHHTNIVPVHATGCERGVHYYAMQFIEGQSLAEVIASLRTNDESRMTNDERMTNDQSQVTEPYVPQDGLRTEVRHSTLGILSSLGIRNSSFFRTVAQLGVQAAEALEHAHQLGIVHRDIKPGNLLVDARGQLWITDFGLAQVQGGTNLTMSGDLLGTLRYMSPEQALAKRVAIDHRTDIYSLGVTLYELLTLEPAFPGHDRQELLRQIAFEEPKPPKRLNRVIPVELETIVLKAMEKNPTERYATAQELADDLERFLKDEPVRARRPTLLQRARKWGRRHQAAVAAGIVCLLMAVAFVGASIGWIAGEKEARRARAAEDIDQALQEAIGLLQQGNWPEAKAPAQRARGLLAGAGGEESLQQSVDQVEAALAMVQNLELARLEQASVKDGHFDDLSANPLYAAAFCAYNLPVMELEPDDAAEFIAASPIREQLLAALVDWARIQTDDAPKQKLAAVLRLADDDAWRQQLRAAVVRQDWQGLARLAKQPEALGQPPSRLVALAKVLAQANLPREAEEFLRSAQQRHPDDFWINHDLAGQLQHTKPPQLEEAIGFYRVAVGLRPQSPGAHVNLGYALNQKGRHDEAIAEYREATRIDKNYADAHFNLGLALREKGQLDEAIVEYREVIRIKKDYPEVHADLGGALQEKGRLDEAIAEFREALGTKQTFSKAYIPYVNLGRALLAKGRLDEAIAAYHEALRLKPDDPALHTSLGLVLRDKGQLDEAMAQFREAIRLDPNHYYAHYDLGILLCDDLRDYDGAIAAFRKTILLKPELAEAHCNLGIALQGQGLLDEAISELRVAIRLKPNLVNAYARLGSAFKAKGLFDEAVAAYKKAIQLEPKAAELHAFLGVILCDGKRDYDGAMAAFQEAVRLKPDDAVIHYNLGQALSHKGLPDQAVAAYRKAIQLRPAYEKAYINLGIACNNLAWRLVSASDPKLRDPLRAVEAAKEAVKLMPKQGAYWNTLGVAHYRIGEWKAAIAALEHSMALREGGDSNDWFFLAMAHGRLGEKEKARKWFEQAVRWMEKNDPKNDELAGFRAEAERVLGIEKPANPEPELVPPPREAGHG
jgi:tetratricopeptide (TPR) repeat protein/tRNA A-37 threonylcarbamoyl transferase component Bud32